MMRLPRMIRVRQNFAATAPIAIRETLVVELAKSRTRVQPGDSIAIGVGSRGITHLAEIVSEVIA